MQQVKTENLMVIDIETAPCHSSYLDMDESWQLLWQEKTARTIPEGVSAETFYTQRAGVMAEFSKVVCISMGYFTKEPHLRMRLKSFYGFDEKIILQDFLTTLNSREGKNNRWCFAGHNIKEFDIPFICRRLLINQLPIPPFLDFQNMKPWETNIIDTFQYWRFGDYKHFTSLKLLAACMGIPSPKDDIDGSMVGPLFWNGTETEREHNLKRIAGYCQKDVIATANIILRFKNISVLAPDDIDYIT